MTGTEVDTRGLTPTVIERSVARRVKAAEGFLGTAHVYQMVPPFEGCRFVIASSVVAMGSGFETLVFPASDNGEIESWAEIAGGRGIDAAAAFEEIGYQIEASSIEVSS